MSLATSIEGPEDEAQLHLLRLVSMSLPVGGFSYSRGLETAVHLEWVRDEDSAAEWIFGVLQSSFATLDGALFWRMITALDAGDCERFLHADAWLAASRETRELQTEDRRQGEALMRLLTDLSVPSALELRHQTRTFAGAFSLAASHWRVSPSHALPGLLWIFVEAQVMSAVRLVPLGQTAGQQLLIAAAGPIRHAAATARTLLDEHIGATAPALALASAWHETQYNRLYQS